MSTQENKRLMQAVFAELATGNGKSFVDAMADDIVWTIAGRSAWSRTWRGKQAVREELLRPLFARFADTYTNEAQRFIAEDDHVVIECRGRVTTKSGQRYDNVYCYLCRFADGKLRELTEYMDTDLALRALGAP
jgi:ketosteroid isomerase-like protein